MVTQAKKTSFFGAKTIKIDRTNKEKKLNVHFICKFISKQTDPEKGFARTITCCCLCSENEKEKKLILRIRQNETKPKLN